MISVLEWAIAFAIMIITSKAVDASELESKAQAERPAAGGGSSGLPPALIIGLVIGGCIFLVMVFVFVNRRIANTKRRVRDAEGRGLGGRDQEKIAINEEIQMQPMGLGYPSSLPTFSASSLGFDGASRRSSGISAVTGLSPTYQRISGSHIFVSPTENSPIGFSASRIMQGNMRRPPPQPIDIPKSVNDSLPRTTRCNSLGSEKSASGSIAGIAARVSAKQRSSLASEGTARPSPTWQPNHPDWERKQNTSSPTSQRRATVDRFVRAQMLGSGEGSEENSPRSKSSDDGDVDVKEPVNSQKASLDNVRLTVLELYGNQVEQISSFEDQNANSNFLLNSACQEDLEDIYHCNIDDGELLEEEGDHKRDSYATISTSNTEEAEMISEWGELEKYIYQDEQPEPKLLETTMFEQPEPRLLEPSMVAYPEAWLRPSPTPSPQPPSPKMLAKEKKVKRRTYQGLKTKSQLLATQCQSESEEEIQP